MGGWKKFIKSIKARRKTYGWITTKVHCIITCGLWSFQIQGSEPAMTLKIGSMAQNLKVRVGSAEFDDHSSLLYNPCSKPCPNIPKNLLLILLCQWNTRSVTNKGQWMLQIISISNGSAGQVWACSPPPLPLQSEHAKNSRSHRGMVHHAGIKDRCIPKKFTLLVWPMLPARLPYPILTKVLLKYINLLPHPAMSSVFVWARGVAGGAQQGIK